MKRKVFSMCLLLLCILLLSGCATYVEPPSGSNVATIRGSIQRKTFYTWNAADLIAIDGKKLGMKMSISSQFNILPGKHQILVNASFNNGFGHLPQEGVLQIPLFAKPNRHYVAKSLPNGTMLKTWIEDGSTQKRVSAVKSTHYSGVPITVTVVMPHQ